MDGVLVETSEAHFRSWLVAARHFGFPFDRDIFLRYYGMNNASILQALLGEDVAANLITEIGIFKENCFREDMKDSIELLPGVSIWLERFQGLGFRQAVASSGPLENIEFSVDATGIRSFFTALVSCSGGPSKPDPWVFQEAARQLKAPSETCLVIEDTPNGITAARSAGMYCLAVTTSNPASLLQGANLVVENLSKLDYDSFRKSFLQEVPHE